MAQSVWRSLLSPLLARTSQPALMRGFWASALAQQPASVPPAEAQGVLKSGGKLLDVRTPSEFAAGSVPGSINVPVSLEGGAPNTEFLAQVSAAVAPGTPLVCACAHGRRGGLAAEKLEAAGFAGVVNMQGGLAVWADQGLPVAGEIKAHK